jgi:hypothetical protein
MNVFKNVDGAAEKKDQDAREGGPLNLELLVYVLVR